MNEDSKASILKSLKPLFEEARRDGLWFFCAYQQLWFSPDELEAKHQNGKFIWGPVNWRLRAPAECEKQLMDEAERAGNRIHEFRQRRASQ